MARKKDKGPVDLNVTSFMNLMIVLVSVLLLNIVLTVTTMLEIKLHSGGSTPASEKSLQNQQIELIIRKDHMTLNFPAGVAMAQFDKVDNHYDFKGLQEKLKELKQAL